MNAEVRALELLIEAKKLGITQLEIDVMRKKLEPNPMPQGELKPEQILVPPSPFDGLSEEEVLYWATPYGLELEEKRKRMEKQKQEEKDKE